MIRYKTFNEWQLDKPDIFQTMFELKPLNFMVDYPPETLSLLFKRLYGRRILTPDLEDCSAIELAMILLSQYSNKWDKAYEAFTLDYPINASSIRTTVDTFNSEDEQLNDESTINKESAYNSDTLLDSDGQERTQTVSNNKTQTRENVLTNTSIIAINHRLSLLERSIIVNVVAEDIAKTSCLAVY